MLVSARELAEDARTTLSTALTGAHDLAAEAEQAKAVLHQVVDGAARLCAVVEKIISDATTLLTTLTGSARSPTIPQLARTPENPHPTPFSASPSVDDTSSVVPPERIERLRGELPDDVPPADRRPPGAPRPKTHGRWIGPDGRTHAVQSGEDGMYPESATALADLGFRRKLTRASDVEMKLAAHMRNHGIHSATLVINNTPCVGEFGCDRLVPVLLPAGATLTVHGANGFEKTYRGGAKPPWRKD
ncbi:DddA-like double-stranded DNA deaminase toxin [Saccharothrix violaceirubra]